MRFPALFGPFLRPRPPLTAAEGQPPRRTPAGQRPCAARPAANPIPVSAAATHRPAAIRSYPKPRLSTSAKPILHSRTLNPPAVVLLPANRASIPRYPVRCVRSAILSPSYLLRPACPFHSASSPRLRVPGPGTSTSSPGYPPRARKASPDGRNTCQGGSETLLAVCKSSLRAAFRITRSGFRPMRRTASRQKASLPGLVCFA